MLAGVLTRAALVLALVGTVWARSDVAAAQAEPRTLREAYVGAAAEDSRSSTAPPTVARYVSESGARFVFDRSGRTALLKFENGGEIWALRPTPGPRGDIIYRNDLDQPVVRTTRLGGLTLFTDVHPEGTPAALMGEARPFRLPVLTPNALLQTLAKASERASRAVRRIIPFEAGDQRQQVTPNSSFLVADAANVTAYAIQRLATTAAGRSALSRVRKVKVLYGPRPTARLREGVLEVVIAPQLGMAGRPSSGLVLRTLASR